jgi:hypothetical protein
MIVNLVVLGVLWFSVVAIYVGYYNSTSITFAQCFAIYRKSGVFCHPSLTWQSNGIHCLEFVHAVFTTILVLHYTLAGVDEVGKQSTSVQYCFFLSCIMQIWFVVCQSKLHNPSGALSACARFKNLMGCAKFVLLCSEFQDIGRLALTGEIQHADEKQTGMVRAMYVGEAYPYDFRFQNFDSKCHPLYLRTFYTAIQDLDFAFEIAWHRILYSVLGSNIQKMLIGIVCQYASDFRGHSSSRTFTESVQACVKAFEHSEHDFITLLQKIDHIS